MATASAEIRHKLTDKQYQLYSDARKQATEVGRQFEAARQQLAIAAELILDFYKVDLNAQTSVDDATRELVVVPRAEAAAPAAPAAPAPKRVRKPRVPAPAATA